MTDKIDYVRRTPRKPRRGTFGFNQHGSVRALRGVEIDLNAANRAVEARKRAA